jgi:hypothetical protein
MDLMGGIAKQRKIAQTFSRKVAIFATSVKVSNSV